MLQDLRITESGITGYLEVERHRDGKVIGYTIVDVSIDAEAVRRVARAAVSNAGRRARDGAVTARAEKREPAVPREQEADHA